MAVPRFRLRTLVIFMTIAGTALAWLGIAVEHGRKQRRAVQRIQQLGGSVIYDFQVRSTGFLRGGVNSQATSSVPRVVRQLLGDDLFHGVTDVSLHLESSHEDLSFLEDLPHLKSLYLDGDTISAEELRHLVHLQELEDLSLRMPMTDSDLQYLAPLRSLRALYLMGSSSTYRIYGTAEQPILDDDDYNSEVTAAGIEYLASEVPGIRISY